jgi:hypothetical protein
MPEMVSVDVNPSAKMEPPVRVDPDKGELVNERVGPVLSNVTWRETGSEIFSSLSFVQK